MIQQTYGKSRKNFFEEDTHILVYFQDEIPILALVMLDMSDLAHVFTHLLCLPG